MKMGSTSIRAVNHIFSVGVEAIFIAGDLSDLASTVGYISGTFKVFSVLSALDHPIILFKGLVSCGPFSQLHAQLRRALPSVEIVPANRCCASPRRESETPDHPKKPDASWVEWMAIDRRAEPRYKLTASVELEDAKSGVRIKASLGDLGLGGCQVHSNSPFPVGTDTNVHITKGKESFDAQANVVSSLAGKTMGLEFTAVEPGQLQGLKKLLAAALKILWLASNRRKSQRILMAIAVRVSGYDELGSSFKENTHTISISPLGALILISASVRMGQRLVLSNIRTKALVECTVAHKGERQDGGLEVGLQFGLPNPTFWGVTFPPSDWSSQHPDSKSRS
jgi:hypothetical protein